MRTQSQAMLRYPLPLEHVQDPASGLAPSNFRILIVNEDMRSADTLKRTLSDMGYFTTLTAYSARRALAAVVDFAPAVALLDLELPDMTGYQLANEFRGHLSNAVRRVPLLAIAELPRFGNAELTRAAGFMGCLSKPVERVALNALLGKLQSGAWS
jgi:two-component system sensor histidine kinase TorS